MPQQTERALRYPAEVPIGLGWEPLRSTTRPISTPRKQSQNSENATPNTSQQGQDSLYPE